MFTVLFKTWNTQKFTERNTTKAPLSQQRSSTHRQRVLISGGANLYLNLEDRLNNSPINPAMMISAFLESNCGWKYRVQWAILQHRWFVFTNTNVPAFELTTRAANFPSARSLCTATTLSYTSTLAGYRVHYSMTEAGFNTLARRQHNKRQNYLMGSPTSYRERVERVWKPNPVIILNSTQLFHVIDTVFIIF